MSTKVDHDGQIADDDLDTDAILAELEADNDSSISTIQTQRLAELKSTAHIIPASTTRQQSYTTLTSDEDTLRYTTEHEKAIVHFFHPDFARCSIMDEHLTLIAQSHADFGTDEVKFARVDVKHAEFVVQKLNIRVLPCVVGFVDGQVKGRIVGFEGVAWGGREQGITVTRAVEERLVDCGVLRKAVVKSADEESESEEEDVKTRRRGITGRNQKIEADGDSDWE